MDASENIHVESPAPWRRTFVPGALLLFLLISILAVPSASAAVDASDTVSEVAATTGAVVEPVTAATPPVATPPPSSSAPAPPPPSAPSPSPTTSAPSPTSVTKSVTDVVDRALESGSGSPASEGVAEPVRRVTEAVGAVAKDSGVTTVPVVEGTARRAGATVGSQAENVTERTRTGATPQDPSPTPDIGDQTTGAVGNQPTGAMEVGPAAHGDRVGSPSPSPRPANDTFTWSGPRQEAHLTVPGDAFAPSFAPAVDIHRALEASASMPSGGDAGGATAPASNTPTPAPLLAAAVSSLLGGASSTSFVLLLLGLLAGFALAVPRTPARRLATGCRYRSALFVCALERPG